MRDLPCVRSRWDLWTRIREYSSGSTIHQLKPVDEGYYALRLNETGLVVLLMCVDHENSFDFEMGCSETWLIFGSCNIMEHINWLYLAIHSIINLCGLAGEKSLVCDGFNKYNKRDLLLVSFLMMMMMIEDFLLPDCWGSMYMLVSNHPWDRRL